MRRMSCVIVLFGVLAASPALGAQRTSVASGRWSAAATWVGGQVPADGDSVIVAAGTEVIYDVPARRMAGMTVQETAALVFDPNASAALSSSANVVIEGRLTMRPSSAAVEQLLRFVSVNEAAFVGGGMVPLATDTGLWVMHAGRLDVSGTPRSGWLRLLGGTAAGATTATLEAAPTGWQAGDEIAIAPTESPTVGEPAYSGFDEATLTGVNAATITWNHAAARAHPRVEDRWSAEVMNLTRNVRIEGTPTGRAHVFIHSQQPQTVNYAQIRYMGPRKATDDATEAVLGRYGLHFHHGYDGSRGSQVIGTVVRDTGAHAFVPHFSHGITFRDTVSYDTVDEAYWWDLAADPASLGDETHDTLYDHAMAAKVLYDPPFRGYRLGGFSLGQGLRNVVRDSVGVGVRGNGESSGFNWPESNGPSSEHGVWDFSRGNVAHNNAVNGIFIWQNDTERHLLANFDAYHNGSYGLRHGAYGNIYHYINGNLYGNGDGALYLQAVSSTPLRSRFDRVTFDGAGIVDHLIVSDDHTFDGTQDPTVFRNAVLRRARVSAVKIGLSERANPDGLDFEYPQMQDVPADVVFTADAPVANVVRWQADAAGAVRITRSGRTTIAPFAPPAADRSLPQSSLTAPVGGSAVAGTVTFDAYAFDDTGIARLDLYVDNVLRGSTTVPPYRFTLATAPLGNGWRTFQLRATDLAGNVNGSNIASYRIADGGAPQLPSPPANDHAAPEVHLFTPAKNQVLAGVASVTADAYDDFGISKVEFYASQQLIGTDTSLPYALAWNTLGVPNGQYTIVAKAYDYSGNTATDEVINVNVDNEVVDVIFANGFQ